MSAAFDHLIEQETHIGPALSYCSWRRRFARRQHARGVKEARVPVGLGRRGDARYAGRPGAVCRLRVRHLHPKNTWILDCRNLALQCMVMKAKCTALHLVQAHFTPMLTLFK